METGTAITSTIATMMMIVIAAGIIVVTAIMIATKPVAGTISIKTAFRRDSLSVTVYHLAWNGS